MVSPINEIRVVAFKKEMIYIVREFVRMFTHDGFFDRTAFLARLKTYLNRFNNYVDWEYYTNDKENTITFHVSTATHMGFAVLKLPLKYEED